MCLLIFSILLYHVHISYLKISTYSLEYSHRACHVCQETWCYQIPEVTMITPNNNNFFSPCHVHFSFLWLWVCVLLEPSCAVSGNPITLLDLSFRSPQPLSPLLYRQSSQCTWSQNDRDWQRETVLKLQEYIGYFSLIKSAFSDYRRCRLTCSLRSLSSSISFSHSEILTRKIFHLLIAKHSCSLSRVVKHRYLGTKSLHQL